MNAAGSEKAPQLTQRTGNATGESCSDETSASSSHYEHEHVRAPEPTLELVQLAKLQRDPEINFRGQGADAPDEQLKRSLHADGLLEPLLVWESDAGLIVLDGNRRLPLLKELELREVPARVWRGLAREQAVDIVVTANERRKRFSDMDRGRVLKFHQDRGTFDKAVAQLGIGKKQAKNLIEVAAFAMKFPEVERQILAEGKFSATHARELARALPETASEEVVSDWINRINHDEKSVKELKRDLGVIGIQDEAMTLTIDNRSGSWLCRISNEKAKEVRQLDHGTAQLIRDELKNLVRLFDGHLQVNAEEPVVTDAPEAMESGSSLATQNTTEVA